MVNIAPRFAIPFPYLNPAAVDELAGLAGRFTGDIKTAQQESTAAVKAIARDYQSAASQQMLAGWTNMWDHNGREIVEASTKLQNALVVTAPRSTPFKDNWSSFSIPWA